MDLDDELNRYLKSDPEQTNNCIQWWIDKRSSFPYLSRMALDYLTIPATSTDVERLFSQGHLLLTHVRSRLSAQSTCALLCLGSGSLLNLVRDDDVQAAAMLPEIDDDGDDMDMDVGWDAIHGVV